VIFNWTNYFVWVFFGIFHSVVIFTIPLFAFKNAIINGDGFSDDIWSYSVTSFTALVFVLFFNLTTIDCEFKIDNFPKIV